MIRTLDDFLATHAQLAADTAKLLAAFTDESLAQAVAPGHRNLGQLAWHLVVSVPEMMLRTGLPLSALDHETTPPSSAAEIVAAHGTVNSELAEALRANWTDSDLVVTDDMYGQKWPRGQTLTVLVNHEIHHRGQMTVLMRQAGLVVPGIFGPALEEWGQFGMEAPSY